MWAARAEMRVAATALRMIVHAKPRMRGVNARSLVCS
jgi:hypothetical protein